MKILNIVLHSDSVTDPARSFDSSAYEEMYKSLSEYYSRFNNVRTVFVLFSEDLLRLHEFQGDKLILKGRESIMPGLMIKSLEAFILCDAVQYDYVVRTNISSVINFKNFEKLFESELYKGIEYSGGFVWTLNHLEPVNGIVNRKYFGIRYASGTLACYKTSTIQKLLRLRHYIDYSVCEDLSFGVFCKTVLGEDVIPFPSGKAIMNTNDLDLSVKMELITQANDQHNPILWRNKSSSRKHDAECIKFICELVAP